MCQIFSCTSHWHFPILPCKTTLILFKYASSPCPATTYLIQAKVFIALNESWWTYPLVLIAPGMWSSVNREMWRKIWWKTLRKDFARADTLKPYSQKTSQSNHTRTTVQSSRSVVSDYLQLHESQHARPPCPSPTPGVHSGSHPSSRCCHPAISSSIVPFSSCPQSLPASESFPTNQFFAWGGHLKLRNCKNCLKFVEWIMLSFHFPSMLFGQIITVGRIVF